MHSEHEVPDSACDATRSSTVDRNPAPARGGAGACRASRSSHRAASKRHGDSGEERSIANNATTGDERLGGNSPPGRSQEHAGRRQRRRADAQRETESARERYLGTAASGSLPFSHRWCRECAAVAPPLSRLPRPGQSTTIVPVRTARFLEIVDTEAIWFLASRRIPRGGRASPWTGHYARSGGIGAGTRASRDDLTTLLAALATGWSEKRVVIFDVELAPPAPFAAAIDFFE